MLEYLRFQNYKGFDEMHVSFEFNNVIVGANNVGKSTIMDSLSLFSYVLRAAKRASYELIQNHNNELEMGFNLTLPSFFSSTYLQHNNEDVTAISAIRFADGLTVKLEFQSSGTTSAFIEYRDRIIRRRQELPQNIERRLFKVPYVAPLESEEKVLKRNTVLSSYGTHLTPRHFRNYWSQNAERYEIFCDQVHDYLPNIVLKDVIIDDGKVKMYFQEGEFIADLSWVCDGYQIWLQLMTHLLNAPDEAVVILDEPDVFLHSDLQRRLVHLLKSRKNR